jgi:hypothetical protein
MARYSKARDLFPGFCKQCDDGDAFPHHDGSYGSIFAGLGKVIWEGTFGSYSGEEGRILRRHSYGSKGQVFGFVVNGYGSCSHCDSLQACSTVQDLDELIEHLEGSVQWGTADEIIALLQSRKDANTWYASAEEWDRWVTDACDIIRIWAKHVH